MKRINRLGNLISCHGKALVRPVVERGPEVILRCFVRCLRSVFLDSFGIDILILFYPDQVKPLGQIANGYGLCLGYLGFSTHIAFAGQVPQQAPPRLLSEAILGFASGRKAGAAMPGRRVRGEAQMAGPAPRGEGVCCRGSSRRQSH